MCSKYLLLLLLLLQLFDALIYIPISNKTILWQSYHVIPVDEFVHVWSLEAFFGKHSVEANLVAQIYRVL